MRSLRYLEIKQPYIALFGSGNSLNDLPQEEFDFIKSKAFTITINYAPLRWHGHLNMWSDRKVSEFLSEFYHSNPKQGLFLAQRNKVPGPFSEEVDFWFSPKTDELLGNYTIVWALQLLQKYFPNKLILLFGVDMYALSKEEDKWYDRYTNYDREKRGENYKVQKKLLQCAQQIERFCRRNNVFNCNLKSQLDFFKKRDWRTILPLKIVQLCPTALAGAPAHLSKIINKYSSCESKSILKQNFTSHNLDQLRWDYDLVSPNVAELNRLAQWADIIHYHRKPYGLVAEDKKTVLQYHSPPNNYVPEQSDRSFQGRKLVIAQYHPRFYTDAFIVPNMIDIWEDAHQPDTKPSDRIKIFYSWAFEQKGGWSDKGSAETIAILKQIRQRYGQRVEIVVLNNRPYEECLRQKRTAHICIDECVTGSYHLQSLEGCAVGALTFNNIDEKTLSYIAEVSGQDTHPFVKTNLGQLFEKLCFFIENPEVLKKRQQQARAWMELHWDPRKLVQRYLKVYFDLMLFNQIQSAEESEVPLHASPVKLSAPKGAPPPLRNKPLVQTKTAPVAEHKHAFAAPQSNGNLRSQSIQALYQKYQGQTIYVFGTGPSLFQADPAFFEDKICFGINFAFEIMPHIDYHFAHVIECYELMRTLVDNKKLVLPETLVRQWHREPAKRLGPNRMPVENPEAFIYPIQDPRLNNLSMKHLSLKQNASIFTWSTTTHSAIHLAAYMGAKKIRLIGVDYQTYPNGKVHFNSKLSPEYSNQDWNANRKHQQGDRWLTGQLYARGVRLENWSVKVRELSKVQMI